MRKLVTIFILVPLAIVFVLFAVANREIVTLTFDPLDPKNPAFALKMPLFLLSFVLVGVGVLIGGLSTWLRQHRWRVRARQAEQEARSLREELIARRWPHEHERASPPAPDRPGPLVIPPAA